MTGKKINLTVLLLPAVEAVAAVIWLGSLPAEAENALAFGYSMQRLLLMGGLILPGLFFLLAVWRSVKSVNVYSRLESILNNSWVLTGLALAAILAWILAFSPAYQWGPFAGYRERLLPAILWLQLTCVQFCLAAIVFRKQKIPVSFRTVLMDEVGLFRGWGVALGVIAILVAIVAIFRIGLIPDIVYWNDFNVPVLGVQIIGVVAGSNLFFGLLSRAGFFTDEIRSDVRRILPDLVICLLLWGTAVVIWTRVDMPQNYFSPGPYPPNNEMYPFSDAVGYDRAAMNAVIGEGLGSKVYVDKPIYVAFLATIHMLVGNQMNSVVGLQVAVIALLPVLLYLLGRKIHSRLAGLMAAGFFIFREMNNIQGTLWVLSTNSRLIMSESLVGLLLAFFVYFLTRWVANKQRITHLLMAGGTLGLASLVRLNPLIVMPITVVGIWLVCWKRWKMAAISSLIFFAMFLSTLLPWMLQSYDRSGKFLYFMSTMHGVVLEQRTYYALNNKEPVKTDTNNPNVQLSPQPTSTPIPTQQKSNNRTWNKVTGITRYVSGHFFHNLIDGIALFPTSLTLDSLEKTIKSPDSYWSADWNGSLPPGRAVLLILTLAILALGLAAAWSRFNLAGLVPVGFLAAYSLATAVVRTSSGRYFLPADWVFLLYFAIGITQVVVWVSTWLIGQPLRSLQNSPEESNEKPVQKWMLGSIICLFIIAGALPALFDRFIPERYPAVNKQSLATELSREKVLPDLGLSEEQLAAFLKDSDAVAYRGMGLYPRYYPQDKGEPDRFSAVRIQAFPRLVMDVIGPAGNATGVLPLEESPDVLPNGSDVLAIGCRGEMNDDWLALIAGDRVYLRTPATTWACPAKLPVCDNNRVCQ
jgi:4-amino-4-deoxy-L-arabinose transferase-like glycosyltransferase